MDLVKRRWCSASIRKCRISLKHSKKLSIDVNNQTKSHSLKSRLKLRAKLLCQKEPRSLLSRPVMANLLTWTKWESSSANAKRSKDNQYYSQWRCNLLSKLILRRISGVEISTRSARLSRTRTIHHQASSFSSTTQASSRSSRCIDSPTMRATKAISSRLMKITEMSSLVQCSCKVKAGTQACHQSL